MWHLKKKQLSKKSEANKTMKKWMKHILPQTIQDCHHLRTGFIPFCKLHIDPLQVIAQLMRTIQSEIKEFRRKCLKDTKRTSRWWFWFLTPLKNGWFWVDFDFLKHQKWNFCFQRPSFSHIFGTLRFRSVPMKSTPFRFRYLCATAGALGVLQACLGTQLGNF